jgi:hypothetical protein
MTNRTDKNWFLLLAVAAGASGAAAAMLLRSRHHRRAAAHLEHNADIKSWENEGGGFAAPSARRAAANRVAPL